MSQPTAYLRHELAFYFDEASGIHVYEYYRNASQPPGRSKEMFTMGFAKVAFVLEVPQFVIGLRGSSSRDSRPSALPAQKT